jgi:hypothetical protein
MAIADEHSKHRQMMASHEEDDNNKKKEQFPPPSQQKNTSSTAIQDLPIEVLGIPLSLLGVGHF